MAKALGQRPSNIVGIGERWAAYQFDAAVTLVGNGIENASQEMQELGEGTNKRLVPRYTMDQLLDSQFRLPSPPSAAARARDGIAALKALAQRQGSRVKLDKVG